MTVLLMLHPRHDESVALAARTWTWWEARGHKVVVWDESMLELPDIDVAISLGGDGTMLKTVQLALPRGFPVLGVNLGHMGYLAEVEPAALEPAFIRLLDRDYVIEERMVLEVDVATAAAPERRLLALNEVVVEKTAPGHTIRVAVALNGRPFLTYVADGLLACTPTGSTAYNLSARGPVLSPHLDAIVLTPVAPHLVFDRSLVLEPGNPVEMTLLDHEAAAVIDGSDLIPLSAGDRVACRAASERARLVTFGDVDFHSVLRARFSLTDR